MNSMRVAQERSLDHRYLCTHCYSDNGSGSRFGIPPPAHGQIAADVMAFAVLDSLARGS